MHFIETVKVEGIIDPPRLDENGNQVRCVLLYSGGLDSTLAALVLKLQGIDVRAVNMSTGFCTTSHRRAMGRTDAQGKPLQHEALSGASELQIPIDVIDIRDGYLDVLTKPKHGWGKAANPCVDCRIFMLRHAEEYRMEIGAHFIATGEVVGQRPMTQMRHTLRLIEREAGLRDMLVRPLSQRSLWETEPERRGWVDRNRLLDFHGRGRQAQLALAQTLHVIEFPQPAGGCCFLTDRNYAVRLKDLIEHQGDKQLDFDDVLVLRVGRQFRLPDGNKVVVGRDEAENNFLERTYAHLGTLLTIDEVPGPTSLYIGNDSSPDKLLAGRITARYSDLEQLDSIAVRYWKGADDATSWEEQLSPLPRGDEQRWMLR